MFDKMFNGCELRTAGGGRLTIQDAGGNVHIAFFERPVGKCRSTIALAVDPRLDDTPDGGTWQEPVLGDHNLSLVALLPRT
jgi:hypothetical protein